MNSRLLWHGFLVILVFLCIPADALQNKGSETKNSDGELCAICGIPARVVLNASPGPTVVPRRHIYLFIEPPDFTVDNLTKAFERLSSAYPNPIFLTVIAFSNREFLEQLIKVEEVDYVVDFADTPEGHDAQQKHSELYPPKKGYFRAYYLRTAVNQEGFQYTPNLMDEKTVQVFLKGSTTR